MVPRVIWSGIQAGERNKGICVLQGRTIKGINERSTDNRTNAVDRAQIRVMLFAIGICLDEYFDSLVYARDDLIEAFFKCFEIGAKAIHPFERHAECRTQ